LRFRLAQLSRTNNKQGKKVPCCLFVRHSCCYKTVAATSGNFFKSCYATLIENDPVNFMGTLESRASLMASSENASFKYISAVSEAKSLSPSCIRTKTIALVNSMGSVELNDLRNCSASRLDRGLFLASPPHGTQSSGRHRARRRPSFARSSCSRDGPPFPVR
jgi:hypothetical protein